jgi:hypothetical protein
MVNRIAVVIRPGQPFVEWALGLDDSGLAPGPGEATVHLVERPDDADLRSIPAALADDWPAIFELELESWCLDPTAWPKDRTLGMFQRWFRIEIIEMIHDLGVTSNFDDE